MLFQRVCALFFSIFRKCEVLDNRNLNNCSSYCVMSQISIKNIFYSQNIANRIMFLSEKVKGATNVSLPEKGQKGFH